MVRVRIAPSPSGNLHVGTARTALFNALFALKAKRAGEDAAFILRIEDTDKERSSDVYTQNIYDSLKALGLQWDEGPDVGGDYGPYTQSERTEIYQRYAKALLDAGLAYECRVSDAELTTLREQAAEQKVPFVYRPELLSDEQQAAIAADTARPTSIRFRIPRDVDMITVTDAVRGDVPFEAKLQGDFVILKSDGTPTYNFAVVVDDALMRISHVIRGEDHLPNTPKQQLIYQALASVAADDKASFERPVFAHVGMILAPDRSKLSKRHGATAVSDYVAQGYLPEAFVNFMALLGWSSPDGEEIFPLAGIAERFSLDRLAHSGAIFDKEKLDWMNGQYIRAMELSGLLDRLNPYLKDYDLSVYTDEQLQLMIDIVREPLTVLSDVTEAVAYFFGESVTVSEPIQTDVLNLEESQQVLTTLLDGSNDLAVHQWDFSSVETLGPCVKSFAKSLKPMKMKVIMWAIRAATTGRVQGADLASTLYLLGKERTQSRLQSACQAPAATA